MKLLYTDENPALVGYVREVMKNEGFDVVLKNEYTSAGMAPPYNIWLEIWLLDEAHYEEAAAVVDSITSAGNQRG